MISYFEGYTSYLAMVDDYSLYSWVFLCKTKETPVDLVLELIHQFGMQKGGLTRCGEGGELALSENFGKADLTHHYVVDLTGPDTYQQNADVERFKDRLHIVNYYPCTPLWHQVNR